MLASYWTGDDSSDTNRITEPGALHLLSVYLNASFFDSDTDIVKTGVDNVQHSQAARFPTLTYLLKFFSVSSLSVARPRHILCGDPENCCG